MERKKASSWYNWLWAAPFVTVPSFIVVAVLLLLVSPYDESIDFIIALFVSSLPHLILLIPALNRDSLFVRWHGRQALLLAGLHVAIPLGVILIFTFLSGWYYGLEVLFYVPALFPVWLFGTLWGQGQAKRGECSLMRWVGLEEHLPGPEVNGDALVDIIRFNRDPEKRSEALSRLHSRGMVESLDGSPITLPLPRKPTAE